MSVLTKIRHNPEKIIYGLWRGGLLDWMSDEQYIKLTYRIAFGRKLNLDNPQAFTEKINWYKLNWRDPLAKKCADKYEVREYVRDTVGEKYLNEMLGLWNSVDEIDFSALPQKFVLKPTNGSGDVLTCEDKNNFDWESGKKVLQKYSKRHFSGKTKEWAYYDLPYRILGERFIESSDENQIKDYKFFCFDGEPKFLFVASERGTEHLKFDFFDMDWNWLPVTNGHEHNPNLQKPVLFDEMVAVAGKLSAAFPHVRVDLYEEEGKVYFGELTFYHFGGFTKFEPDRWDFEFGKYFDISKVPLANERRS
ncbi:MAG: glycosyl transferase [Lachnospiraceae bacterium]|nr:glycosyl transferase [Lachnospiraceae bacterium]